MNSSFKDSEIKAWKQKVAIEKCYDKLFKKISPKGHEMYYLSLSYGITELGEKFHLVRWDYRGTGRSDVKAYSLELNYEFSTISHGLSNFSITTSDQFRALKLGIVPLGYRKFEVKPFDFEDFFSSLDIPTLNFIGEKDNLITLDHSL
ncbi:9838_t:CDS:2 [Rhizophagus irregularis]|nr:9838_t:CDS:2 [Rhizophagus irregularis]